jgi:hypothetical protein
MQRTAGRCHVDVESLHDNTRTGRVSSSVLIYCSFSRHGRDALAYGGQYMAYVDLARKKTGRSGQLAIIPCIPSLRGTAEGARRRGWWYVGILQSQFSRTERTPIHVSVFPAIAAVSRKSAAAKFWQ